MSLARVANIGPRERKRRFRFGLVAFGISVATAAALIASGASPRWRLAIFIPLFAAALGYFQALALYLKSFLAAGVLTAVAFIFEA